MECCGFESHLRQLIFLRKNACLGYTVLLCLVVCLTLLASSFLPSASLISSVYVYLLRTKIHVYTCKIYMYMEGQTCNKGIRVLARMKKRMVVT